MLGSNLTAALAPIGWSERVAALFSLHDEPGVAPARVVRVERGAFTAVTPAGVVTIRSGPPVAVGDWLAIQVGGPDDARLIAVLQCWSELARLDPDGHRQVLAANVDIVFIAAPADRLSPARVERELVIAWDSGARPVVLLTKSDLAAPDQQASLEARLSGVELIATSATTGTGVDQIRTLMAGGLTAVLLGPSGAGKSSLLNALMPGADLAVGAVREGDHRGRHTTTQRELFALPSGGTVIDMPGLRSLALDADGAAVSAAFRDVEVLAAGCRFADCSHEREPGCAVLAAVADGALDGLRLESFRKLERESAFEQRRHDPLARQAEARIWKARSKAARKHPKRPR